MLSFTSAVTAATLVSSVFAGAVISDPKNPPHTSENGQYGYNDCRNYPDSANSNCQTSWINDIDDWCLWAPPSKATIGDSERYEVAWCTKAGHGTRLIPEGTLTGVHFTWAEKYVQITGTGKFTQMNIPSGDEGGELDPHGADGNGNPIGGLLLSNIGGQTFQFKEWTQFISDTEFCIRACYDGPDSWKWCSCYWNMPANYDSGSFDQCNANLPAQAMGEYKLKNGATSTWHQGVNPTPAGQNPPASSSCHAQATITPARYGGGAATTAKPTTTKKATTTKKTTTKKTTTTKKKAASTHKAKRSHEASI
ncbi:uncharacterized protein JCM15063_004289 [Sporobolomyces koalae]|uniref:uncharacterized protein n=1 Tax=Sporobolomyces koalae TaxID=500713 RepID=UPI00317C066C